MASQEKYNQIHELERRSKKLKGKNRIAMIGQVDFPAANNLTRGGMNIKHKTQHLAIHDPEFPMVFDGKENVSGENSSYFNKAKKNWKVIDIIKKYNELMNGNSYIALYFLYCDDDDSYKLIERKEVENLPENFGFRYKNDYLDSLEIGETIPQGTVMQSSRSYDDDDNTSVGVNARILYAAHPAVQDDAIICSESFAKRMIATNVKSISIPINEDTILLNLYGKDGEYKPLPDIGEKCNGIVAASRIVKEARSFSDLRDSSLNAPHGYGDTRFFGTGTIVDINVYCNRHDLKRTKTNSQLLRYYHDACWFYTKVYKRCNEIINKSGSRDIDREINRWFRLAKNYLDRSAQWAFNDSVFTNMYVEIIVAKDEPITVGRKITGRHGNKTVTCMIMKDEDMPYLTREVTIDKYGVKHAAGIRERVDLITNPLAIVNRTIAMALIEGSLTFILDITRKHAATLDTLEEKADWIFDILGRLNKKECDEFKAIYKKLSPKRQKRFIDDCISLNPDGTLRTDNGMYVRFESFSNETNCRDAIINVYQTYPDIFKPYNVFMPKPKWGRDIFVTEDYVGYQYIMMLKQSGEKGFSVRSAGSISDESLPEKSHDSKISKLLHSNKPIRFGEYETPNFMVITSPEDFALVTALYRTSIDGRRFMYESILSQDGMYEIPDDFTSRSVEILQVYLKSLGVRMYTVDNDMNFIGEGPHLTEVIGYQVGHATIFCTRDQMYYLNKLNDIYGMYIKQHPDEIDQIDDVWDYIVDHLTFKKKYLTDELKDLFVSNMTILAESRR